MAISKIDWVKLTKYRQLYAIKANRFDKLPETVLLEMAFCTLSYSFERFLREHYQVHKHYRNPYNKDKHFLSNTIMLNAVTAVANCFLNLINRVTRKVDRATMCNTS